MSDNLEESGDANVREQDKFLPTANIARIMKKVRISGFPRAFSFVFSFPFLQRILVLFSLR